MWERTSSRSELSGAITPQPLLHASSFSPVPGRKWTLSRRDLCVFRSVETAEQGRDVVKSFYRGGPAERLPFE
ncbi:hypothetical protein BH10PSE14_BH10PSE14_05660 [soil metagenome]